MSAHGFGQPRMAEPRRAFNTSRLRNTARLYSRPALGCPGQRRRRAPGAERLHQLRQPPPRPHDLHTVKCPVADVVGIGQDRHMRRRQPVPAGQRSPRYRRSPEHSLWAATVTRIPSREPSRSAVHVSSLTGALTECDKSKGTWPALKTYFASSIATAQCAGVSPPACAGQAQHRLACTPLSQQRECRTMLVLYRGGSELRKRGQRWRGDALWSSRSRER